jgi:uncharacterized repeat protein (TIGR01451 family)
MLHKLRRQLWLSSVFAVVFPFLPQAAALAQMADMRLSMSHSPETVTLGASQNVSYVISVTNNGPAAATNVTLTDVLDPSFLFVFATVSPPSQGSCMEAAGTVTCDLHTMGPGVGANITIQVTPMLDSPSIINTASVVADQPDPNPANNFASNALTVSAANSDMRITMTHSPEFITLGAGQNLSYSLSVTNPGPSTATTVTVTDVLDPSLPFVSATVSPPSQGSCDHVAGTVTCDLHTMAPGVGANITIQVTPTSASTIANTATVSADQPDFNPANNTATNLVLVKPDTSDMRLTMTHSPQPVTLGQNLSYVIGVTNSGPSTATTVTLTDPLPPGVLFAGASVSPITQGDCSEAAGTVTCTLNTFASGTGANVTIVVTPLAAGTITNTASVIADQADPNPANNLASNDVTIVTGPPLPTDADLRLTLSRAPDIATLGDDQFIRYTASISNGGPATATGVTLTDSLPANVAFAGYTVSPATQGSCSAAGALVTCSLNTLDVGLGVNVTIYASSVSAGAVIPNTVSIAADQSDPNPGNNSATDNITINSQVSDVRVTMSHSPDRITLGAGQFLQYFISMSNSGPSPATGGSITDTLPPEATFAGFTLSPATQGDCSQAAGTVSCTLNPLASGAGVNLTIFATPNTPAPTVTNTVTVAASEADPNPANNIATEVVAEVAPTADVRVTMTHSPDPATIGVLQTYSISVVNNGPSPATSVILSDGLPAEMTFGGVSISPPTSGLCMQAAGTVTCTMSSMASGTGVNVTVFAMPNTIADVVSNTATVVATEPDPIPANNSATDNVTVIATGAEGIAVTKDESVELRGEARVIAFTVTDLGPVVGAIVGPVSSGSGQAVGYSLAADGNTHGVIYSGEGSIDLGTLGGPNSYAIASNSAGVSVGQSETLGGEVHAFLYSKGELKDLGTLGGRFSAAWGVSDAGEVVGTSTMEGGYSHAFLYRDTQMTDLNSLIPADSGWSLKLAYGFDPDGRIVGQGTLAGEERAFLLTPVEPRLARTNR